MIQSRRDQVRAGRRRCSAFWPRSGAIARRRRACRVSRKPKIALCTWSRSSAGAGAGVSSPRSRIFPGCVPDSLSQTPPKKRNHQRLPEAGPRFFVFSSSRPDLELEEPQNGLRPFGEIPDPPRSAGGAWATPRGLCLTFDIPRSANTGPLRASFFGRSDELRPAATKKRRSDRRDGFLAVRGNSQRPSTGRLADRGRYSDRAPAPELLVRGSGKG